MSKVSIITPCYNVEKFIGRAIKSVIAQTFTNWEHVIVDDGSNDDSAKIIASYTQIEPRLRLLKQANGGVCNARNNGFKASSPESKYLLFFDADDTLEPEMLEVMVKILDENPHVGFAYCGISDIDEDDRVLDRISYSRLVPSLFGVQALPEKISETPFVTVAAGAGNIMEACCVFRRCIYEKTSGWPEWLGQGAEGMDLYIQFALLSTVYFVPQKLYKYRQHPNQCFRRVNAKIIEDKLIAKWKKEAELTPKHKFKIAHFLWFYQRRLKLLKKIEVAKNLIYSEKYGEALLLYTEAAKDYLVSFFPIKL